jgi:hypothetical protein
VIAPYAQFHWSDYRLNDLQDLLVDDEGPGPDPEEYFNYGITIYFLNGPH